ncbi:small vasohibin-binding protein [Elgaria multicarinata webbii]|uniref:small vasohibin-binding protein n=1 Tax=Elgaria multicarinata webbii TaxID=159646 RepID=UPI002FCCD1F5
MRRRKTPGSRRVGGKAAPGTQLRSRPVAHARLLVSAAIFLRRRRMEPGGGRREKLPPPQAAPPKAKEASGGGGSSHNSRLEKAKQRAAQQELKQRQRAEIYALNRVMTELEQQQFDAFCKQMQASNE